MRNAPVLLILLSTTAAADSFTAKVIGVTDGDTITVRRASKPVKIELHGVDCPEKKQPFGQKARRLTRKMVFGRFVTVVVKARDRNGRAVAVITWRDDKGTARPGVARTTLYKRVLNDELVKAGLAWHSASDRKKSKLAKYEADARKAKRGLWAEKYPVPPWKWRRGIRGWGALKILGARSKTPTVSNPTLASRVGSRVSLRGRAAEAKAGSVIVMDGTKEPVYVKGLQGWGKLLGKRVIVTGLLRQRKMIPDPVVDKSGAISQGAVGRQYLLENARWLKACRADNDCRLIKCCCNYIALPRGEKPQQRCMRPCMCSKAVVPIGARCEAGVCRVRKKASPSPKHDSACYKKCLRRSSMQAVSWEAIKAQCRTHCAAR